MSRFLRFCTVLLISLFSFNAFADYTCPTLKTYTLCKAGYYLSDEVGADSTNSCQACPTGWTSIAGAVGIEQCHIVVTLNKSSASGSITGNNITTGATQVYSGTTAAKKFCYYNQECTLPSASGLTLSNYSFPGGWRTEAATTANTAATYTGTGVNSITLGSETTSAPTYYAVKSAVITVTLNKNGGSNGTSTIYLTQGSYYETNTFTAANRITNQYNSVLNPIPSLPTKSGSSFKGYYTAASGGTQVFNNAGYWTGSLTTASTLYAQWTTCPANTYGTSCTACPTAYPYSDPGSTSMLQCYQECAAGTYIATVGGSCVSASAGQLYFPAHRVYSGRASGQYFCPRYGQTSYTATAGADSITDCVSPSVSGGTIVPAGDGVNSIQIQLTGGIYRIAEINLTDLSGNVLPNSYVTKVMFGSSTTPNVTDGDNTTYFQGAAGSTITIVLNDEYPDIGGVILKFMSTSATSYAATVGAYNASDSLVGPQNQFTLALRFSSTNNYGLIEFGLPVRPYMRNICSAGTYRAGHTLNAGRSDTACSKVTAGYYNTGCGTSATGGVCSTSYSGGVCTSGYSTGGATSETCTACIDGFSATGTAASNHDSSNDCKKSITLNKNGGTGTITTPVTCSQGVSCSFDDASVLTQTGYTFVGGWGTDASCISSLRSFVNPPVSTYYACKMANEYTITLDKNNAGANNTGTGTSTLYTTYNTNVYNDSDRSKAMTTSANGITAPEKVFTVTYNANNGTVSPTSANATSTFGGYYSAESSNNGSGTQYVGTTYITSNGLTAGKGITANATWYAKWSTPGSVTLPTPTRNGYTFNGWYTAASGGTKVGDAGATYTPTASVTLYAHWTANTFNVSYDGHGNTGGSAPTSPTSCTYAGTCNAPSNTY
ncbi:MAG: InlB B-repeat-containing protein, partial [Alphaproteobacteria bacterium]|nr:InlB B-repeat-containing protein [Alphaproteobacteria bacterium]